MHYLNYLHASLRRSCGLVAIIGVLLAADRCCAEWVALEVFPPRASLHDAAARQGVVVVATRDDGVTRDVTGDAAWNVADGAVCHIDRAQATPQIVPQSDGQTTLQVAWEGLQATADVTVSGSTKEHAVSFRHDVIPVLLRAGCNGGGCHGSSRGMDGFRLSLFGFDPSGDYFRLTREQLGRRLDLALPTESLILTKATGGVPHGGGKRFEIDSEYYRALEAWLVAGAPDDTAVAPTVDSLALYPPRAVLEGAEASQRFLAVASYSDGTLRDVTAYAVFQTNNSGAADVDEQAVVRATGKGEAFITARFDTHTVGSQTLILPPDAVYEQPQVAAANYIDELVEAKLQKLRISPSVLCGDDEFLRRVTIDIAGRLPTAEERQEFLADTAADKRARKVDGLLALPEFTRLWAKQLADLLLVRTEPNRVDYKPMFLYWQWLQRRTAEGAPLDEIVRDVLTASGSVFESPAGNFYQIEPEAQKVAENAAQALLGIRIQCAQCHNHPFDRWTMDDYYSFTAFFAQVGRKRGEDYRDYVVFDRRGGETNHPVDNRVMAPKFLGDQSPDIGKRDRREVLAEWIVAPDNPYFAASMANRIWAAYMGVGVVEPVDDIRVSNPPSNPELFAELGRRLTEYNYDVRLLVRDICTSNAYQRTSQVNASNAEDTRNFAHAAVRRIPAETLLDCICQTTESPDKLPGLPLGSRAVEVADGRAGNYFLTTFGRAKRDTVCACEAQTEPTLSQALHLLNGDSVWGKIRRGKQVERWLEEGRTPVDVVAAIYERCLSRDPTPSELEQLTPMWEGKQRPVAELEDVYWAVLNSREFVFNH
ncbi:MAG: DUF1553 domain-containing protein [Planctomycetales bacterium]|nr:DUF1553 domain-containing protein [Planctomycetales bacterium]